MSATDDIKKRVMTPILPKTKPMTPPSAPAGEDVVEQSGEEKPSAMETDIHKKVENDINNAMVSKVEAPTPVLDNYERMAQLTDPNRPLSPYEQEQLDKKRKREAIFSALGDGISSLANVYFSTQGAYDMLPDPSESLSAKSKARWDKIKADRDAKDLRFYENVQRRQAERRKLEAASKLSPYEQEMMKWRMRNADSQDNYRMAETQRKAAADQAKAEETKRVNDARIANYNSQIYKRAMSSDNTNRYYTMPIQLSDGEIVDVEARILKDRAVVNKLFNYLPEADRLVAGSKDSKENYKSPTLDEMMRAVFDALPNNPDMQAYLRELSQEQKKPATKPTTPTKDFSQYKETAEEDFSQYKRK